MENEDTAALTHEKTVVNFYKIFKKRDCGSGESLSTVSFFHMRSRVIRPHSRADIMPCYFAALLRSLSSLRFLSVSIRSVVTIMRSSM